MRDLALGSLAVLALSVRAPAEEPPSPARKAMREYMDAWLAEEPWPRRDELAKRFSKETDAPSMWFEEVVVHPSFGHNDVWRLDQATRHAFEGRLDDLKPGIAALIRDKDETRAELGALLATQGGFATEFGVQLVGLLAREDDAANVVRNGMVNVRDPEVIALLIEETKKPGTRGSFAVSALGNTNAPDGQPVLRKIALDRNEEQFRREQAMHGLSPFTSEEDRKVADALLSEENEGLALAAVLSLLNSDQTTDPALLRKARPLLKDTWVEGVDQLLCTAGDEEGLKVVLEYARKGSAGNGRDHWYGVVAKSPLPAALAALVEDLGKDQEQIVRWSILNALGQRGDAGSIEALAARLQDKEDGEQASDVLSDLAASRPGTRDAILDRVVADQACAVKTLRLWGQRWGHLQITEDQLVGLEEACLRLFERGLDRPTSRHAAAAALRGMTGQDFGQEEADLARWKEWWAGEVTKRAAE